MREGQPFVADEVKKGTGARRTGRARVCIAALAVAGMATLASADECVLEHPEVEIALPEREDFVEAVIRFDLGLYTCLDLEHKFGISETWTHSFPVIRFKGSGQGLFEAKIVLTEVKSQLWSVEVLPETMVPTATERTPSPAIVLFGGGLPNSFDATTNRWLFTRPFSGHHSTSMLVAGTAWQQEVDVYDGVPLLFAVTREFELRLSIRRVPNRCYMHAVVTGGRGAGEYSGDVAFFGNPAGLGSETVAGLEGMLQWAQQMKASMGTEDDDGAESESEEVPATLSGLAAELEGIKSLTLQDVKLGSGGGTGSLGGFGEMISAFNLTAHDVGLSEPYDGTILDKEDNTVGNLGTVQDGTPTHLGLKAPGLAIANLRDCNAAPPEILFTRCPGEEEINMEQSPYCGRLLGKVCHEAGHKLTVHVEFIAGDAVTSCIQ